jgi:2'-5' RNA ligase
MSDGAPMIVTAALDDGAFSWFEERRQRHFPRHRNHVPAHLTLFHALPGDEERSVTDTLKAACQSRRPLQLEVRGPWFLGRGVAYRLASSELERLRTELSAAFSPWLTPQDRAPFRPHITIQNKTDPADARLLLERLQQEFEPFAIVAEGLWLWRYLGGPWQAIKRFQFDAP